MLCARTKSIKSIGNTNMVGRFYELKYFSSLFNFYLSSVIGCLGNSTSLYIHITVVIIEEYRESDADRLNRMLTIVK